LELLNRINTNSVSGKLAIMDARPKVNAMANMAKGGGYESEEYYVNSEVNFLNIQNIHVMRESLRKIFDMALFTADDKNYFSNLENSKWIDHLKCVLVGANKIVSKVHQKRSSVLVHCSDGWDRTAQVCQHCVNMFYIKTVFFSISKVNIIVNDYVG
jgi:myotubularin-related protein 1/2